MRTYTKILGTFFLVPLLAVIGCGPGDNNNNNTGGGGSGGEGGGGGGGGGGGSGNALDQLGQEVAKAFCTNSVECHQAETEAECLASSGVEIDEIKAYVENGTIIYHPEKLQACIDALKAIRSCSYAEISQLGNLEQATNEACGAVFEGTIADGGDCFDDEQCKSSECETDPMCMDMCCTGKCVAVAAPPPPPKIGEPCPMEECEAGAYCPLDMMGMPTTCAAQLAAGAMCDNFDQCKAPSVCDIDLGSGMGVCTVLPALGETCNPNSLFGCDRYDNVCDPMTMKCILKGLVGAACMDASECVDYAYCDSSNKCAKDLGPGAACDLAMNECLGDLDCINGMCGFEPQVVCK